MEEDKEKKIRKRLGKIKILILPYINASRWGPATLAKHLLKRPLLIPSKHRNKKYEELFNLLEQHYHDLEKIGYIKKDGYGSWELQETARDEGYRFISTSDETLESKEYIPHNKRLIFWIKSMKESVIINDWKKDPMIGWNKWSYGNERVFAEIVPANKLFGIDDVKGLVVRLKDSKWYSIVKTEEDVTEVNALYDSEIIHEANLLAEKFSIDIDTLNPQELLQDGEIKDEFTKTLPNNIRFTTETFKYNSAYGGERGNKKLEFKSASDVKNYLKESVSTQKLSKIREFMPEIAEAICALADANSYLAENINTHIPLLIKATGAMEETRKAVKKLPKSVERGVERAMSKFLKQLRR